MWSSQIIIDGLKLHGYHGVLEQERTIGNEFQFDIVIGYDFCEAALVDKLDGTLNYASVIETIKKVNDTPSSLLENLCWRLNKELRERFPNIGEMTIKVSKLSPPIRNIELNAVSIVIKTRKNEDII